MTVSSAPGDKPYLTPIEAARLLMVAPVTLRAWATKGLLTAHTTAGGHRRFLRKDLATFAATRGMHVLDDSPEAGPTPVGASGLRVLVVDDDHRFAAFLRELLELNGVTAAIAFDGFAAGRMVESFKPNAVLLDLRMPGLDGFAVCRQLKTSPATAQIRVIAMTGYAPVDSRAAIVEAGAEVCLAKPFSNAQLLGLLGVTPGTPPAPT